MQDIPQCRGEILDVHRNTVKRLWSNMKYIFQVEKYSFNFVLLVTAVVFESIGKPKYV